MEFGTKIVRDPEKDMKDSYAEKVYSPHWSAINEFFADEVAGNS